MYSWQCSVEMKAAMARLPFDVVFVGGRSDFKYRYFRIWLQISVPGTLVYDAGRRPIAVWHIVCNSDTRSVDTDSATCHTANKNR